jgi:hypothetical protein
MSPAPNLRLAAVAATMLLACTPAQALTYLVGAGAVPSQCDFNSLQAAIDAAAANPGEDYIRVANDQSYSNLALTIGQQDLTITGGYANCTAALPADALPTGSTVLDGAGGVAAPVVSISGSGVRVLSNLQIRNGDNVRADGTGCGGGIRFSGRGELVLKDSGIAQNSADVGGGICFSGTAVPTALTIRSGTSINNNTAVSGNGGGIQLGGQARLFILEDGTLIAFNEAMNGLGGGLSMVAPAVADIGSPGFGNLGVIYANRARRGGGLAAVPSDSSDEDVCARLYSTDPQRPVRLQQNVASEAGGAIFTDALFPFGDIRSAFVRAYDFRFDGNRAPNGAAIFAEGDSNLSVDAGSSIYLNRRSGNVACNEALAPYGRVPCTDPSVCNRIEDNRAENLDGQATNGNVIELRDDSDFNADRVTLARNRGSRLLSWSGGDDGRIDLSHCAFLDNVLTQELVRTFDPGEFGLVDCTIAGNTLGVPRVLHFEQGDTVVTLNRLLIAQPGAISLTHPNVGLGTVTNQWIVSSETASLRPDPSVLVAAARFIDPERGDYRLRIGSEAVDFAPAVAEALPDLDNRPRDVDFGDDHANTRPRDVGAYERQPEDPWLLNGDFEADLRLWSNLDPTHATWNGDFNAPDSLGGSLSFAIPSGSVGANDRRAALSQCFNVPAAGDYQVFGRALVAGTQLTQDYPVIRWRLRYGSASCAGLADAEGERFFGRSSSTWQPLSQPLVIPVDAGSWTWNTTIELVLEAAQNPQSPTATGLFARFDAIEILRVPTTPDIFSDGFEE